MPNNEIHIFIYDTNKVSQKSHNIEILILYSNVKFIEAMFKISSEIFAHYDRSNEISHLFESVSFTRKHTVYYLNRRNILLFIVRI